MGGREDGSPKPPPKKSSDKERGIASHHHNHHHHHDASYLISANKHDPGVRITRVGLFVNLGMAIAKGFGGIYFNSKALLADAIHSLTDLVSDIMTLATVSWSLKPPTPEFPSGYGKVESLGSLGVSGILLGSGLLMGWAALFQLTSLFLPALADILQDVGFTGHHSHIHDHAQQDIGDPVLGPDINAAWLAAGSILIKEYLYRATLKVANEKKSTVLASNAYHHRVDSLTAFVALIMIGGSNILPDASWLDPIGGLVISLMIVQAGWSNTKDALLELADVGVQDRVRDKVHDMIEHVSNKEGRKKDVTVRYVQGVKAGQNYLMDAEICVPGAWTVAETRAIEEKVREKTAEKVRGVKRLRIRFVPKQELGRHEVDIAEDEFVKVEEREMMELMNGEARHHHHKHHHDEDEEEKPKKKHAKKDDDDGSGDEKPQKKHHKKDAEDSEDEDKPKKKHHKKDADDSDEDEKPKKKKHKDDDDDTDDEKPKKKHHHHKDDDDGDVDDDDKKSKKKKKAKDDDDDDDDDDDKPKKKHHHKKEDD